MERARVVGVAATARHVATLAPLAANFQVEDCGAKVAASGCTDVECLSDVGDGVNFDRIQFVTVMSSEPCDGAAKKFRDLAAYHTDLRHVKNCFELLVSEQRTLQRIDRSKPRFAGDG